MRKRRDEFPKDFDEYARVIFNVCSQCQPDYSGMNGAVGYLYESVKDNVVWNNLDSKMYVNLIMGIGRLHYLSEKDFNNMEIDSTIDNLTVEDVKKIYAGFSQAKEK